MFRRLTSRLATGVVGALLGVMLLGVGGVSASTPNWGMTVTPVPDTVAPGNLAGYTLVITNSGPSNISQLFLDASQTTAAYASTTQGSCVLSPFQCSFGALNAGGSITVIVAFTTPTSGTSFSVVFQLNTSGATFSDKGGNSHGDTFNVTGTTTLNGSPDFTGGFTITGADTLTTSTNLSKKNPQSSRVTAPILLGVTLAEGSTFPGTGTDPCSTTSLTCVGQWDNLHVGSGTQGPIKLVLTILGSTVPGNTSLSDFEVWHEGDGWITTTCDAATPPGNMPCISVSEVGNNFQIVVWLEHNGALHSAY